jgi:hypothetical protein
MLSHDECLTKAAQLDALALQSSDRATRQAFVELADRWRRTAIIADVQDDWLALNQFD